MKITHTVYNSQICKRVERKLRRYTKRKVEFFNDLSFPISYKMYIDGVYSNYSFDQKRIQELLKLADSMGSNRYEFVIQVIYVDCLDGLLEFEHNVLTKKK